MPHSRSVVAAFLLLAACGSGRDDPTAGKTDEQLRREIEAVATAPPKKEDLPPPFRLRPLKVGEVQAYASDGRACWLGRNGLVLFVTRGPDGIANVDGDVRRLNASGPVGPTGGYFATPGVTISIGRVGQYAGEAQAYVPEWAADVAVGGKGKTQEFEGRWACRG